MCVGVVKRIDTKQVTQCDKNSPNNGGHQDLYIYLDEKKYGIVWRNVIIFTVLHLLAFYGLIINLKACAWNNLIFSKLTYLALSLSAFNQSIYYY